MRPAGASAGGIQSPPPSLARRQRSELDGAGAASRTSSAPAASGPVRIDRSDAGAAAAADLQANAFTTGNTIVLPSSHGPLDGAKGRSLLAHELVHVDQQRRLGNDLPPESSTAGQELEREARSAEVLVGRGTGRTRMPAAALGTNATSSSGAVPAVPTGLGAADSHVRDAANTALTLASHGPDVDGSPADVASIADVAHAHGNTPQTAAQRQDASAIPASTAGSNDDSADREAELEALAHQLYERIRYRIGRELLLDRERAGVLTDMR